MLCSGVIFFCRGALCCPEFVHNTAKTACLIVAFSRYSKLPVASLALFSMGVSPRKPLISFPFGMLGNVDVCEEIIMLHILFQTPGACNLTSICRDHERDLLI